MTNPHIPINEADRQAALNSYYILDTLPEEDYDNIIRLAAIICNTPIAFITLIDSDRQFFKAALGMDGKAEKRDFSFCAHAINKPDEPMIVPDARHDERFADNPYVTGDPHIVFYAGMPLVTPDGFALGSICVVDKKPNEISKEQTQALKSLSQQVIQLMELRKKNILLMEYQRKLELHATDMESFAYMASHDLKDPLRMINIFTQKLSKNYAEVLDDKANEYLSFCTSASKKMTTLVNDLLKYAALDKDDLVVEEIKLEDLVQEIISTNKPLFKEAEATVICNQSSTIKGYKTALKIILQNLFINAIKFKKDNNALVLNISVDESSGRQLFKIEDNGIGIEAKSFKEIFKPFKSLHPRQLYTGSGMGLAACKKIVEQHGGNIWVESELGKGSIFYFTFGL